MTKKVTVDVSSETHELLQAIRHFVATTRKALADGWQPGKDIPVVLQAAFTDLVPQIQDLEKISQEPGLDKQAFIRAVSVSAEDIAFDLMNPVQE